MILNGDQPLDDLDDQLDEVEFPRSKDVFIHNNWNLQYYAQFQDLMKKRKPSVVIIDSLIGCSGGRAFDENKSDFAQPLYWLTRNNGVMFPRTTILIIHHANKQGGFRGTSAIRDAVTETWRLAEPTEKQVEEGIAPRHSRIIHVEKSRSGRSGTALIMRQESDLTFSIADFTAEIDSTNTSPSAISDRVLSRVRSIHPRSISRTELNADPIVGGNVDAIRKSLHRWVKRGLITAYKADVPTQKGGKTSLLYKAVVEQPPHTRVRGEGGKVSQPHNNLVMERTLQWDKQWDNSQNRRRCPIRLGAMGQVPKKRQGVPLLKRLIARDLPQWDIPINIPARGVPLRSCGSSGKTHRVHGRNELECLSG